MHRPDEISLHEGDDTELWVPCPTCSVATAHKQVLAAESKGLVDGWYGWLEKYQIIQCQGCKTLSFRHESSNSEDLVIAGGEEDDPEFEPNVVELLYPPREKRRSLLDDFTALPANIIALYLEAHLALVHKMQVLTGLGIRALVESVCKDKGARGNLSAMIDELVGKGVLKAGEAAILHKLRFMGNQAAHEFEPHSDIVLNRAFDIVEHMLTTVYLLSLRARALPNRHGKAEEDDIPF